MLTDDSRITGPAVKIDDALRKAHDVLDLAWGAFLNEVQASALAGWRRADDEFDAVAEAMDALAASASQVLAPSIVQERRAQEGHGRAAWYKAWRWGQQS